MKEIDTDSSSGAEEVSRGAGMSDPTHSVEGGRIPTSMPWLQLSLSLHGSSGCRIRAFVHLAAWARIELRHG